MQFGNLRQLGKLTHFVLTFVCLDIALSDTGMLNSFKEFCITRMAVVNSFVRVLDMYEVQMRKRK